jgi:hypothetical protein
MTSDTQWQSELDGLIDSRLRSLGELDDLAFHAAMAHPLGCHLPAVLADQRLRLRATGDAIRSGWSGLGDACLRRRICALGEEARWPDQLRVWRHQRSIDLILRDVAGIDRVQDTLRGSSEQAELCCQWALDALYAGMVDRHGVPRSASGASASSWWCSGLGKLGGSELNFSSDIDLVFAFPEQGETDGARPLDNETFFVRLGQQFIKLLGDTTAQGFGFRVDMRLRPFGTVGRLALVLQCHGAVFPARGARLGALRLDQGATHRGRHRGGRTLSGHPATFRVSALFRLHRVRRPARNEGDDRGRSAASRAGRPSETRTRRHS